LKTTITMNFDNIPQELKECPQFVLYGVNPLNFKQPHSPLTLSPNGWQNPRNWGTYADAMTQVKQGKAQGIGFCFNGGGIYGIDLDLVFINGQLIPEAHDIVFQMRTFTEQSSSGNGLHIYALARSVDLLAGLGKGKTEFIFPGYEPVIDENGKKKWRKVEYYQSSGYFAMTGSTYGFPMPVVERDDELQAVYAKYSKPLTTAVNKPTGGGSSDWEAEKWLCKPTSTRLARYTSYLLPAIDAPGSCLTDEEVIAKASTSNSAEKFNRLWNGDTSDYFSQSEADLAFCNYLAFWCGGDMEQMDRLFMESNLWRDKWDRDDYRRATLEKAVRDCQTFYSKIFYGEGSTAMEDFTGLTRKGLNRFMKISGISWMYFLNPSLTKGNFPLIIRQCLTLI